MNQTNTSRKLYKFALRNLRLTEGRSTGIIALWSEKRMTLVKKAIESYYSRLDEDRILATDSFFLKQIYNKTRKAK